MPKPPRPRIVSQRYSSSPSVPSAWLCQLVSGASWMRLAQAGPRVSVKGSRREVIIDGVVVAVSSCIVASAAAGRAAPALYPPAA